jgi:hypothetical protein
MYGGSLIGGNGIIDPMMDGGRHNISIIIIDMLTDQVDPSRREIKLGRRSKTI